MFGTVLRRMADNVGESRTIRDLTFGVWRRLYVSAGIPVDVVICLVCRMVINFFAVVSMSHLAWGFVSL